MHTAKTVAAVATKQHPLVSDIMNREFALTRNFAKRVMAQSQFSWHGRRPKPSLVSGKARKTNLDLLSVLMELYHRKAQVELTAYDNKLPWQVVAGEQHVGSTKRYGPITNLVAHEDHLSFSLTINDLSVVKTDGDEPEYGAPRSYMIADYNGDWHAGWHGLSWNMTMQERAFFNRRKLLTSEGVDFEDYIHQNRRQSVYGAPYLMLKLLLQRIEDEIAFYKRELRRLEHLSIECPDDLRELPRSIIACGDSTSIEVPVFHMQVRGLALEGTYPMVPSDALGYRYVHRMIRFLQHELRPIVQFMVRADEAAFYRFALKQGFVAHWVRDTAWRRNERSSAVSMELADSLILSYWVGKTEKKVAV